MRILLVEDDTLLGKGVSAGLVQVGWAVDWVVDGFDGAAALRTNSYDASSSTSDCRASTG